METDEPFQYSIENEEELNLINPDMLDMPDDSEQQVFYMTVDNPEEKEKQDTENECLDQAGNSNFKLITLEDGRMFLTTDDVFEKLSDGSSSLFVESTLGDGEEVQNLQITNNLDEELIYHSGSSNSLSQDYLDFMKNNLEQSTTKSKFICTYDGCDKTYSAASHLKAHERSHDVNNRPFLCTEEGCDKRFATNYSLSAHRRTHTGETPYGCSNCKKRFKTSGDLLKHNRIHTGEKPFICPFPDCGKSFTTSNIRKVHIRSHTGERPYKCDYPNCGKAFISSTNFKNHLRIHSGEKPYVCQVEKCGRRFTEYSSLYKHQAVHLESRNHVCIFCGQRFKQEPALNLHKKLKHNVVTTRDGKEFIVKIE